MGFSKINFDSGEEVIETIIHDAGGKSGRWLVMKRDYVGVLKILNRKLNLGLIIKEKKDSPDRDLDWALK